MVITPHDLTGGQTAQGTVSLVSAQNTSTVVALRSSDTTVLTVPANITIPAGSLTGSFTVTTREFFGNGTFACVFADAGGGEAVDCVNVNETPHGPALQSVTFFPNPVIGGAPATGTVKFAVVTDGAIVHLTSSNPAIVQVPDGEVVVNGGQSAKDFPVTTSAVTTSTIVTITATATATSKTGTITVIPGTPPAADIVHITKATWKKGLFTVQATSTNFHAILSVFVNGNLFYELTNKGNGKYSDARGQVTRITAVTVKSNFGGQDSSAVT
jgi:hypothetical protein